MASLGKKSLESVSVCFGGVRDTIAAVFSSFPSSGSSLLYSWIERLLADVGMRQSCNLNLNIEERMNPFALNSALSSNSTNSRVLRRNPTYERLPIFPLGPRYVALFFHTFFAFPDAFLCVFFQFWQRQRWLLGEV
jgi:hypothetical protein